MTNQDIERILELIKSQIEHEKAVKHKNSSIGYTEFELGDKTFERFVTRFKYQKERHDHKDIQGNFRSSLALKQNSSVLTAKNSIWRDSPIGGQIIMNGVGQFQTKIEKRKKKVDAILDIESLAKYTQYDTNKTDTKDGMVEVVGQTLRFTSIVEFLEGLKNLQDERNDIVAKLRKEKETSEIAKLQEALSEKELAIQAQKEKIKRHIQQEISLRDNPILDRNQEKIKRSKSYDGELIINGGPGTGKTTALIQRITYLTRNLNQDKEQVKQFDLDIELPKLTKEEQELFNNQKTSWIFFSPSQLLKEYLQKTMIREGLKADDSRVKTWLSHRKNLMRDTQLFNSDKKNAFKNKKANYTFYVDTADNFNALHKAFSNYFWTEIRNSITRVLEFKVSEYAWSLTGEEIQKLIEGIPKKNNLRDWILFFNRLQQRFSEDVKVINETYKKNVNDAVAFILYYLKRETADFEIISQMIQDDKTVTQRPDEQDEDEADINEEIFGEDELTDADIEILIKRKLKTLIRKYALRKFDDKTRLTTNDKRYFEVLDKYFVDIEKDKETLNDIGENAFFKKYFEKMTKGVVSNVLRPIRTQYKKFRRQNDLIASLLTRQGTAALPDILKSNNLRLHADEQDYLIYFIYEFCRKLQNYSKRTFDASNQAFIASYKANMKGLVAVDEATDFSVFELAAMRTLTYYRFNSITLSGDIMQRMETKGLKNWYEFSNVFPTTEISNLTISYRQTYVLLELAKEIYEQNTGLEAPFQSYTEPDENDLKPILFINDDFDEKVKWLVERILEINKMYERNFPSVAVFVKNDAMATQLTDALNEIEVLEDENLEALACVKGQILGDKNCIRIFDIQYIKGLEFEAVFFMDIDDLGDLSDEASLVPVDLPDDPKNLPDGQAGFSDEDDLINKYIYVGVSRATFFLGVTANQPLGEGLSYMLPHFNLNGKWSK